MKNIETLLSKPEYACPVCGEKRYVTDQGTHEITLHCASPEARFWEFERGTLIHTISKQHWEQSRLDVFQTLEDVLSSLK